MSQRLALLALLVLAISVLALATTQTASASRVTKLDPDHDLDEFATASNTALVKVHPNKKRMVSLGAIAIKAILLGPLIGLSLKMALIRGLVWALLAYAGHLFFPAALSTLGLGTGLVGFARQLRPDYNQMLIAYFMNLLQTLPGSVTHIPGQYRHMITPIVDSIRAIPEGHCRYRAVCETASHLIRNSRGMSSSLQRISASVYMNFGNEYSKAWLDGVVQNECAAKYAQCATSPLSMVAARLAQTLGSGQFMLDSATGPLASGLGQNSIGTSAAAAAAAAAGVGEQVAQVAQVVAQTMAPNVTV